MVTRASPGVEAVVAGAPSGPDGGGGSVVSAQRAPALSPSSVRSVALGGIVAREEESLQISQEFQIATRTNKTGKAAVANLRAKVYQQSGRVEAVRSSTSPLQRRLYGIARRRDLLVGTSRRRRCAGTLRGGTLLRLPRCLGASIEGTPAGQERNVITVRSLCIVDRRSGTDRNVLLIRIIPQVRGHRSTLPLRMRRKADKRREALKT